MPYPVHYLIIARTFECIEPGYTVGIIHFLLATAATARHFASPTHPNVSDSQFPTVATTPLTLRYLVKNPLTPKISSRFQRPSLNVNGSP